MEIATPGARARSAASDAPEKSSQRRMKVLPGSDHQMEKVTKELGEDAPMERPVRRQLLKEGMER